MNQSKVSFGTRKSRLALWQTNAVVKAIAQRFPELECEVREFTTRGDQNIEQPLPEIGGKGLFTAELDQAIREGEIDIAIHSLKDLPTDSPEDISIVPILAREDPRDVLITTDGKGLMELKSGAVVGTSSPRREMQIRALRPDLVCKSIRGNVPTRIRKVRDGEFDATVLAAAGVIRLELQHEVAQWFTTEQILPAPGQAMMAATFRTDNRFVAELASSLISQHDVACVSAERRLLQALGGGCAAPIAAFAEADENNQLNLVAKVGLLGGQSSLSSSKTGTDPQQIARELSDQLLRDGANAFLNVDSKSALCNQRVVVTREADQCSELSALLKAHGAQPIEIPSIEFRAVKTPDTIEQIQNGLDKADWIIFTSQNAIRYFFDLVPTLPEGLRAACVGTKSAQFLSRQGIQAYFVPTRFSGNSFAREFASFVEQQGNSAEQNPVVFYPSAKRIASDLPETLGEFGFKVIRVPVYETLEPEFTKESLEELRAGVDSITFASPSAARSFSRQLKDAGLMEEILQTTTIACIGSMTAQIAEECAMPADVVPEQSTLASLLLALTSTDRKA